MLGAMFQIGARGGPKRGERGQGAGKARWALNPLPRRLGAPNVKTSAAF